MKSCIKSSHLINAVQQQHTTYLHTYFMMNFYILLNAASAESYHEAFWLYF